MNEPSGDVASTPYVGLVPYGENDADFFFGRDDDRWVVAGNLRGYRLTILYGPSGVGKTSLLYAGVVPDLRRRPVAGAPSRGGRQPVAVCTFRAWQDEPLPPLMNRLREAAAEALGGAELPPWQRGDSAVEALRAWTQGLQALLVVLDQFEDYFLYHADDEDRGSFAHEFPALLNEPRLRVNFLVSIREDAWAKLDRFEGRVPHLFGNYVRVGHLSRPAAREAIQRPIEEWNRRLPHGERPYTIEPALVEAVVDAGASGGLALGESGTGVDPAESNATEVEAPFLQLVMERVWRAAVASGSRDLTLSMLEQLGGAQTIVRNHLLDALGALTPGEAAVAAEVFRFLVTRSRTKIAHQASDLADWTGRPVEQVTATLEKLCRGESGRILRAVPPAAGTDGAVRYELFHDILAGPILEWRRDYEQERARRAAFRRFARVGAVLIALCAGFAALGTWALVQRNDAEHATRSAVSLALASAANRRLGSHPDQSLLLGLEAYRASPSAEAAGSLTAALESARRSGVEEILRASPTGVRTVAFSPDGRTVASGGFDGILRLWDVRARKALGRPILADVSEIWGAAFSPDGRTVATAGLDGDVRLWDVSTRRLIGGPPNLRLGAMTAVAFAPDGATLALAGDDGAIRLWDTRRRRFVGSPLRGHTGRVVSVAFSPDGHLLASASYDRTVRLWNLQDPRRPARVLRGHTQDVLSVAFSPDGRTLASSGLDGVVRLWDVRDGAVLETLLRGGAGQVWSVAFSPDGRTFACSGFDRTVRLWDAGRAAGGRPVFRPRPSLRGHTDRVVIVAFGPDGHTLASSSYDGTVRVWRLPAGSSLGAALAVHADRVKSVAFSPDGRTLASGGWDGRVLLSDVDPPRRSARGLGGRSDAVESVAFSPDGRTLAVAGHDGAARLFDLATRRLSHTLRPRQEALYGLAFSPDGGMIATAGTGGTVSLWDAQTGAELGPPLRTGSDGVSAVAFSPDGRMLAAVGSDGRIRLWSLHGSAASPAGLLGSKDDSFLSVAFSPDGRTLAAGALFGPVQLWDVRAKRPLGPPLQGHTDRVESVAFSPNGSVLASGSSDGTVRLWDVRGRKELGPPLRAGRGAVFSVAFAPDGETLASGGLDGTVRLWSGFLWTDAGELGTEVCGLVVGNLGKAEWQELAPGVAYRTTCPDQM